MELDVKVSIIFGLYGTDLDVNRIKEFLLIEFEEEFSTIQIEDYLIVKAREKIQETNSEFTIEWLDLFR